MILAGLAFQLQAVAPQPPLPASMISDTECLQYAAFEQVINTHSGVFLGEMHGQSQSAHIASCLAKMARETGLQPVISLELSEVSERRIATLEEYGGKGVSVAVPELSCAVATLAERGEATLSFHNPKSGRMRSDGTFDSTYDERQRADRIKSEIAEGVFVIALSGWRHVQNFHNRTGDRLDAKAGYFLPESIALVKLTHEPGSRARNCQFGGQCGVHDYDASARTDPITLAPYETDLFDFEFNVGRLTPSSGPDGYAACPNYKRAFE
jgi:hypothetical protein